MFVNGEGKLPNIRKVQTINSQRTSQRHLQQPVSADCNDTVRWSNTIEKYVLSVLQKMAPVQCSPQCILVECGPLRRGYSYSITVLSCTGSINFKTN